MNKAFSSLLPQTLCISSDHILIRVEILHIVGFQNSGSNPALGTRLDSWRMGSCSLCVWINLGFLFVLKFSLEEEKIAKNKPNLNFSAWLSLVPISVMISATSSSLFCFASWYCAFWLLTLRTPNLLSYLFFSFLPWLSICQRQWVPSIYTKCTQKC